MQKQKQAGLFGQDSGDAFFLFTLPFTRAASLMMVLNESSLQMYAATANMAFNEIALRHDEALSAMKSAALLACWPQPYLADSVNTVFETIFQPAFATTSMLAKAVSNGGFGPPTSSGRRSAFPHDQRTSAVVINFPDRRKAGS